MQIFRNTDLEVVTHVITRVAIQRALYYPIVTTTTTTTTTPPSGRVFDTTEGMVKKFCTKVLNL